MRAVNVFCGSQPGARTEYRDIARGVGAALARRGSRLIYGGSSVGTMGMIADATLAAGGEVIGVTTQRLSKRAHRGLTELHIVDSMQERLQRMAALSDSFLVLAGGLGTLDELFAVLAWNQLGIQQKRVGLLNAAGYYDPLIAFLEHGVREGFIAEAYRDLLEVDDDPDRLLDRLATVI